MKKGWAWPSNARKAHYFIKTISLCNSWMYFGDAVDENDDSPDNCATCKRKLQKAKQKTAQERLTDAAPDLLAACKRTLSYLAGRMVAESGHKTAMCDLSEAIEKAEGESCP